MIQNEQEYKFALEELKHVGERAKLFNEQKLIAAGYPIWIIRQEKLYLSNRPEELQNEIAEYLKINPKAGYRVSKFRRYRRSRNKRPKNTSN